MFTGPAWSRRSPGSSARISIGYSTWMPVMSAGDHAGLIDRRFPNPAIVDTVRRVAFGGSPRHTGFVLPVLRGALGSGAPIEGLVLAGPGSKRCGRACAEGRVRAGRRSSRTIRCGTGSRRLRVRRMTARTHGLSEAVCTGVSSARRGLRPLANGGFRSSGRAAASRRCGPMAGTGRTICGEKERRDVSRMRRGVG